jgi:hypothetical protein
MSQGNSSSFGSEVISASQRLSSPIGRNLTNVNTRTLAPSMGAIAYGADTDLLYYGSVDKWNIAMGNTGSTGSTGLGPTGVCHTGSTGLGATGNTGQPGNTGSTGRDGLISIGPFSTGVNPDAASITSQVLTLYSADKTNPGAVDNINQSFAGIKTFTNGWATYETVSLGLIRQLTDYALYANAAGSFANGGNVMSPVPVIITRFGAQNLIHFGDGPIINNLAIGVFTYSVTIATEFRPGTSNRTGMIPVLSNGVYLIGAFNVTSAGIITVGAGFNTGTNDIIPFPTGNTKIYDCVTAYTAS